MSRVFESSDEAADLFFIEFCLFLPASHGEALKLSEFQSQRLRRGSTVAKSSKFKPPSSHKTCTLGTVKPSRLWHCSRLPCPSLSQDLGSRVKGLGV